MRNSKGFTAIEGLLILIIVVILGFTGWYVWNSKQDSDKTAADAAKVSSSAASKSTKAADPTADWVAFSSTEGVYSGKHPKTWVTATNPELCSPGITLLGVDAKSVGKCATESFGQISVVSVDGDERTGNALSATVYKDITKAEVTVDSVKGEKQSGTAIGGSDEPGALAAGTKVTKYIFFTKGKTYIVTYFSADLAGAAYTDALADFNTLVTKTFKFSS